MKRIGTMAVALAAVLALASCGGGSSSAPTTPTNASPASGTGAGNVTVSILGNMGGNSFNPNPAMVASGQGVVFKNTDSITHHIMLDDGSMQTADIAPGATSAVLAVGNANVGFHCTIHPDMVGAFNGGTESTPPNNSCQTAYCGK